VGGVVHICFGVELGGKAADLAEEPKAVAGSLGSDVGGLTLDV
jgi:hypothetical protein